jgi:uncharacterized phiE125 gp8 family phage protein
MARFTAPADTSGIHLNAGHFHVKKGVVEVPDDLTAGDRAGLAANGFTPAPSQRSEGRQGGHAEAGAPAAQAGSAEAGEVRRQGVSRDAGPDDLAAVKAYAQVNGTTDDAVLQSMITAYSAAARSYCNRDLTSQDYSITRDGRGTTMMLLPQFPVTAVSSVIVDGRPISAQSAFGLPGYRFTDKAIILDGFCFTRGFGNVQIAFTAGYAAVPDDIAQAVNEWVALRYKERDRIGFASKTLAGETSPSSPRRCPTASSRRSRSTCRSRRCDPRRAVRRCRGRRQAQ